MNILYISHLYSFILHRDRQLSTQYSCELTLYALLTSQSFLETKDVWQK
jgi:hypothetical protein